MAGRTSRLRPVIDLVKDPHGIRQLVIAHDELLAALWDCLDDLGRHAAKSGPGPDARLARAKSAITRATGATL